MLGEQIALGGRPIVGFGEQPNAPKNPPSSSPWPIAIATSVVGAATGWVIEELASNVRKKKR